MISDNIKLYKNYYSIQIKCFCCNINNHLSIQCPMVHVVINKERIIRNYIHSEPNDRVPHMRRNFLKFKVLKNLQKLINCTLKIHRTTTFELYNFPDEDGDDDDNSDIEEDDMSRTKFQRNSKFIARHHSNKEKNPKKTTVISIVAPYRKSKSYTRNFNFDINSYTNNTNISKYNSNSVIYEERVDEDRRLINRSKDTFLTEIKLLAPEFGHSSSNRTSVLSPNTNANQTSNPNVFSYFSMTGANMSTIEKKQETYCVSDTAAGYFDALSPSKNNSNMDGISNSQNELPNENFSEDLESFQSSLIPQKSKASKKSEIIISTVVSQNQQKSSNSLNVSPSLNNPSVNTRNVSLISKKEDKKKEGNFNAQNTTLFLQNNYFQIVSKAREDFENNFEKMKIFDVYFPQHNVTVILEDYRKAQIRIRRSLKKGRAGSISSHSSPFNRNLSVLIKDLPIFKKKFGTSINEEKAQHGLVTQGDGDFRKRRLSEASFLERTKTLKTSKSIKTIHNKMKCKFWICSCCKKPKNYDLKKKPSMMDRRVSVAERIRRASIYG